MNQPPENSLECLTRSQWRKWLEKHHTRGEGIWLITYKKASGKKQLTYNDVVEEALCFGWIDSVPRKLDDQRTMLYFAPRKAKSGWSGPNKRRIESMMAAGLMRPAGMAKIEQAKLDGSWTKLDVIEQLIVPADLEEALKNNPPAKKYFDAFPPSAKRGILEWVLSAKRPETRAKRIAETARLAAENIRANQWKKE